MESKRRMPLTSAEVLKVRLDHMEGEIGEVKRDVHNLKEKVDKHHEDLVQRFERVDARSNGQLVTVIATLLAAVGTLILKLLHP